MPESIYKILLKLEGDREVKAAINDLGKAAGLTGAALSAFSAGVAKLAIDYEQSLANISTVSDETTGSTEEFSEALFDLQKDLNGAINVQEAATASYDILSAGIKEQEAVLETLATAQKVAIAGQGDLDSSTSALISVVNAYGGALGENLSQTERVAKAGNLLIQTQLDGVITGGQYARSIGQVAATAAGAGVSIEEVNAAIATSTAQGTKSSQAFTRLQAVISNIQKPTADATKEAERLGIQFNASRLQAVGLEGIFRDIQESGKANVNTFVNLFGSVEALGLAQQLAARDGELFARNLENQRQSVDALNQTYEAVANTSAQEIQRTLNLLQATLIELGQGALVAFGPIIELASQLAQAFNALPRPIKQATGLIVALGGATLVTAGAVLTLVANLGASLTTLTTLSTLLSTKIIPVLVAKTAALKSATLATGVLNAGLTALIAKAALAAAPFVALATSLELLRRELNNRAIEQYNNDLRNAQITTEPLVTRVSALALKIKETGEAIPDSEFRQWINLLEQANEGNGQLTGIIKAFTNVQNDAKQANLGVQDSQDSLVDSQDNLGESTENLGDAVMDAEAAWADYQTRVNSVVNQIGRQARIDAAQIIGDSPEAIQARLRLAEDAYDQQVVLLSDLAGQSQTTANERRDIELRLQEQLVDLNRQRSQALDDIEQQRLANNIRLIEQRANQEQAFQQSLIDGTQLTEASLGIQGNLLDGQVNLLSRISGLLKDQNTTFGQRADLIQLVEEITRGENDRAGRQLSVSEAINASQERLKAIEAEKLDLKIRQLEIDREQLILGNQLRQLEINEERRVLRAQAAQSDLSQSERENLALRDQALANQANLENQRTALGVQGLDSQLELTNFEARLTDIVNQDQGKSLASSQDGLGSRVSRSLLRSGLITREEATGALQGRLDTLGQREPTSQRQEAAIGREVNQIRNLLGQLLGETQRSSQGTGDTFNITNDPQPFQTALTIQQQKLANQSRSAI